MSEYSRSTAADVTGGQSVLKQRHGAVDCGNAHCLALTQPVSYAQNNHSAIRQTIIESLSQDRDVKNHDSRRRRQTRHVSILHRWRARSTVATDVLGLRASGWLCISQGSAVRWTG